ncbi:MAG: TIGR03790 family protein [Synechococcaceae cyanobacterium]|nr:TIGR03790 family protein [Synechococcaceae cyanobacterium]
MLAALLGVLALSACRAPQLRPPATPPGPAGSGGALGAEQLALVINGADPLSEAIGREYIQARRLPARQVIRVRFPAGRPALSALQFQRLMREVRRRTPAGTQAYALAWLAPWRVECVSITSAFAFGRLRSSCRDTCAATALNPWFARGDIRRPWPELGLRPTMLLAAATGQQARELFRRGLAADGSAPPGTAYLLSSSDPIRNVRAATYPAVRSLQAPGFRVRLLQADGLRGASDVMLLVTGVQRLPDPGANRFRPGAVADHLTSFGGVLTGPSGSAADGGNGQMSALRWLQAGATASYGTVVEPCNLPLKFPDPGLLLAYYRRGDTLLESYWRSVAMPDQGLFIGEPLARPWPAGARPRRAR